jgi:hypothetical protein
MRHHRYTFARVLMLSLVAFGLHPSRVAADPISVSGSLTGAARFALVDQELRLAFPDFAVLIDPQTQLTPRFPLSAQDGSTISLTRTLASFSGHSIALPGNGIVDADVSGTLSFIGPAGMLDVPDDIRFGSISGPVQVFGSLLVTQADRVLFDGSLVGSGSGMVGYEDSFGRGENLLAGYTYQFDALASTPEPTSLLLAATGAAWVLASRRRHPQSEKAKN